MEGIPVRMRGGLKRYWRRKRYERLNRTSRRRRNQVELGDGSSRRRRFWKIKISRKLLFSPRKLLIGLRDAYMNFMLRIASSSVVTSGYGGVVAEYPFDGYGTGPKRVHGFEEKMIVEIYRSLMVAQGMVPRDIAGAGLGNKIVMVTNDRVEEQ